MSNSYAQTLLRFSIAWSLVFSTPPGVSRTEPVPVFPLPEVSASAAERQPAQDEKPADEEQPTAAPPVEGHYPDPKEAEGKGQRIRAVHSSPYCEPTEEGGFRVRPELLQSAELKEQIENWHSQADEMLTQLGEMQDELLIKPTAFARLAPLLTNTVQPFEELRAKLLDLLEKMPASYNANAQDMLKSYFEVASTRAELELLQNPRSEELTLNKIRYKYALEFSPEVEQRLFTTGGMSIAGSDLDPIPRGERLVYRLALNGETTLHAMVRTAARAPGIGGTEKAYAETVRCILGRAILGKYALNKTIAVRGDFGQPLSPDLQFCLGTKTADFYDLVKRDTDASRELVLRTAFLKAIPQIYSTIPQSVWKYWREYDLEKNLAQLAGFSVLKYINLDRNARGKKQIPDDARFKNSMDILNGTVNQEYKKQGAWEKLRLAWRSPEIAQRINSVIMGCGVKPRDLDAVEEKPKSYNDYAWELMRSDDALFLIQLYGDIANLPGRWMDLNKEQLVKVLHEYVIAKKVETSLRAFSYAVDTYSVNESANADELLQVVYADLHKLFTQQYTQIWEKTPDLKKWLEEVADKIIAARADAQSYQQMLTAYTDELMSGAKVVAKTMDPDRPPGQLPYVEKFVVQALRASVNLLSKTNKGRLDLLRQETDPAQRAVMWKGIQGYLQKEAAASGASCTGREAGTWEKFSRTVGGWIGMDTEGQKNTNRDCEIMTTIAMAIGADMGKTPTDLAYTLSMLQDRYDSDKVQAFVKAYRERLASAQTDENRLLDFPVSKNERLWQKMVKAADAKAMEADVLTGLNHSVKDLERYLKNIMIDKDISFFIKRTGVINAVLGQNLIETHQVLNTMLNPVKSGAKVSSVLSNPGLLYVFPHLVKYHEKLQEEMSAMEDMDREVWSEFVSSNMLLMWGFIGGWLVKSVAVYLPRFTGGPAVASMVNTAHSRVANLTSGHADYITLLFAANIARKLSDMRDFNIDLGRQRNLRLSEGVAMMNLKSNGNGPRSIVVAGNPFAMISDEDYYRQKLFFEEARDNAFDEALWGGAFLLVPYLLNHGAKAYNSSIRASRRQWKETNYANIGYIGQTSMIRSMTRGIELRLKLLSTDLKRLGNPAIELSQLQSMRDVALAAAVTPRQRFLVNESYERIVKTFGKEIESYAQLPHLQSSYATALYGNGGSVQSLKSIYHEYIRITKGGML